MFNIASKLQWFGDKVKGYVNNKIDQGGENCGQRVVALAKSYAPVRSGHLRDSISYTYDPSSHNLQILVGMPYGVFQEFGTYRMEPHPFIRPALAAAGPAFLAPFGVSVSMATSLPIGYVPKPIRSQIRPKIASAQKTYSKGKVKRTNLFFHHEKPNRFTADAWNRHRSVHSLFKSKRAWN